MNKDGKIAELVETGAALPDLLDWKRLEPVGDQEDEEEEKAEPSFKRTRPEIGKDKGKEKVGKDTEPIKDGIPKVKGGKAARNETDQNTKPRKKAVHKE